MGDAGWIGGVGRLVRWDEDEDVLGAATEETYGGGGKGRVRAEYCEMLSDSCLEELGCAVRWYYVCVFLRTTATSS